MSGLLGRSPGLSHAALGLGGFAIGTAEFASMSFLPAFSRDLGVSAPTGGHVISAYALGVVIGAPLLAVLGVRLERRRLLVALLAWFGLGNCLSAFAPNMAALLALRFLTALPHGAYFGAATLAAAGLVSPERRGAAIGRVLMGLTVATIVGVPGASLLAEHLGWRAGFGAIGLLALVTAVLLRVVLPAQTPTSVQSALSELGALRLPQVWLTLGIGAVGFGGLFAVYTYLASTLAIVTHAPATAVPLVLAAFGVGMTLGNLVAPRLAGGAVMPAVATVLVWSAVALAIYPFTVGHLWSILIAVLAVGCGGGLATLLQARLMDVAGDAQAIAAALAHAAFNIANALGPWLGGLAVAAGFGWASTGWVGSALALGGLAIWAAAAIVERRTRPLARVAGARQAGA